MARTRTYQENEIRFWPKLRKNPRHAEMVKSQDFRRYSQQLRKTRPKDLPEKTDPEGHRAGIVLFSRTNGLELARFLTLSTSFAFAFKKKKNDRRKM